ncbi:hypothetical protein A0H81_14208 [Grifola frondosa]|uniref:RNB domain-containing protein n=1 Tax=Grifola frondosa TaxID=5627 RepID=A0A1C7LP14_GRIFR|nr:hypothetical protein A0H81_14208 [Grifola frondosa]
MFISLVIRAIEISSPKYIAPQFAALVEQDQGDILGPSGRPQLAPNFMFGTTRRPSCIVTMRPPINEEDAGFHFPQQQMPPGFDLHALDLVQRQPDGEAEISGIMAKQIEASVAFRQETISLQISLKPKLSYRVSNSSVLRQVVPHQKMASFSFPNMLPNTMAANMMSLGLGGINLLPQQQQQFQSQLQQQSNQPQRKSLFAPYLPQASLPLLLVAGKLVMGILRVNKRNRSDAYVATEVLDADIYICGSKNRNRALEGDIVAVELLDVDEVWGTEKEKEEKKRKKDENSVYDLKGVAGRKNDKKRTTLRPMDKALCYLRTRSTGQDKTSTLLKDCNFPTEDFSENVVKCFPPTPWTIPERELDVRKDLRKERIFTIGPEDTKNLNDAVSIKLNDDVTYDIGVHIAIFLQA